MAGQQDALVTTQWVAEHLNDPTVKLVEVDIDTGAYDAAHIAGAVGFNWTSQLQDQLRRDIISKSDLEQLLSKAGISDDDTVILYGDNANWFAAYAFWLLRMYGHQDLRLMDGGRNKWLEEGRPVTKKKPRPSSATYKARELDKSLRALREQVLQRFTSNDCVLVDVRSPAEFTGEILAPLGLQEAAQRGGHIPGAVNIPWSLTVREDGTLRSIDELKALYQGAGVTADMDVITYCRIGERSSHTWYVLKYLLGYDKVRNYDGSWTEWGSLVDVPVEAPSGQPTWAGRLSLQQRAWRSEPRGGTTGVGLSSLKGSVKRMLTRFAGKG